MASMAAAALAYLWLAFATRLWMLFAARAFAGACAGNIGCPRSDAVEAAWRWDMPILDRWASQTDTPAAYAPGDWGPAEADTLIQATGRQWRPI